MCVWIITACFGLAAAPQSQYYGPQYPQYNPYPQYIQFPSIVAGGPPPPILIPTNPPAVNTLAPVTTQTPGNTTTTTATTTTTRPPNTLPPLTPVPTLPPLTPVPTLPPLTPVPTLAPLTPVPTLAPITPVPTLAPLTPVPTLAPITPVTTRPPATLVSTQQSFPLIDPRLQTQPPVGFGDRARLGNYQVVAIEADVVAGSIIFPRTKRQTGCGCYLPALCGTPVYTDGTGLIDFRIVTALLSSPIQQCAPGLVYCCLPVNSGQLSCGSRVTGLTSYPIVSGQARYGDYPWMAVIMTTNNQYVGGGVLIDSQTILTTAHRIASYANGNGLKIRLGEWDGSGNYEQYPYRDFSVARVWMHEAFNPNTLQNDVALVRIVGGVPPGTPAIVPICLPTAGQIFEGQRCWVSGWGKNAFGVGGQYQSILKTVDVPVIPAGTCEATFRTTRLGPTFLLDRVSFLCAGGETNKDACTGDGGSGLVCEVTPGRWILAGLVAWGLGCAAQGVPAAYVNVANYLPWVTTRQAS